MTKILPFPASEYHTDVTHISKSGLDKVAKSPAHYWAAYLDPKRKRKETAALTAGDLFHTGVLEPHLFFKRYVVPHEKVDRRTRDGKELHQRYEDAGAGRKFINMDMYEESMRMRDSFMAHPVIRELMSAGVAETIITFTDSETGAPVKVKPDWLSLKYNVILDVKTAESAEQHRWERSAAKYRYYVQDPLYCEGVFRATGKRPDFVFGVIEKEPPYAVQVFDLGETDKRVGMEVARENMATWMRCREDNFWPGYPQGIQTINIYK